MARRVADHYYADESVREAVLDDYKRLQAAMPGAFVGLIEAAKSGAALRFSTATLSHALIRADHPDWRHFIAATDPHDEKTWELSAGDVLTEVTPAATPPSGPTKERHHV